MSGTSETEGGQEFPVNASASGKLSQPRFCWHGEVLALSLPPAAHFPAQFQLAFTIPTSAAEKRNAL